MAKLQSILFIIIVILLAVFALVIGIQLLKVVPATQQASANMPSANVVPATSDSSSRNAVIPTWTITPSPTAPPIPTKTPTHTPTPTITPSPLPPRRPTAVTVEITTTPEISTTYAIPTVVPRYPIPEEALTIVLLGSDRRPDWQHWNTDVIQYMIVYPDIPSITILSIPRDLYVYIPADDTGLNRINVADMVGEYSDFDGGGIGLLNQTLLYNLGITADYYAKVNFQGLKTIVDVMDGISVPVHCRIEDYWPYPDENGEYPKMILEPGIVHMDGKLALWYSRTRKTTSVFDREERQQQVLEAMWRTAQHNGMLNTIPTLYEQYSDIIETDLDMGTILELARLATIIDSNDVRMVNIGRDAVEPYTTAQGGYVYTPNWEKIEPIIDGAMQPPASSRAALASVDVEIWNGTTNWDWDDLAADRLWQAGYTPIIGQADHHNHQVTRIQVFNTHAKGTGLTALQAMFGVSDADVEYIGSGNSTIQVRLILGANYRTCP